MQVSHEIRADLISCNAVLNACDKGQQWALALDVLETMSLKQILADAA